MSGKERLSIVYIGEHYCALFNGSTSSESTSRLPSLAIVPNLNDVLVEARRYNDAAPWFYCLLGRSKDLNCDFDIGSKHELRHVFRDASSAANCMQAELVGFETCSELRIGAFVNVCNAANGQYRSFARITARQSILTPENVKITRLTVRFVILFAFYSG